MKCLGKAFLELDARSITVLGISGDEVATQAKFAKALGIKFTLLSDKELDVADTYGVRVSTPKGGFASRSVFLIGKDGKVLFLDRDFPPPRTLEGTALLEAIRKVDRAEPDPLETLKDLPAAEKGGKTALVHYVRALFSEDIQGFQALLHERFGRRPGETDAQRKDRRRAEMTRHRDLFKHHEIRGNFRFADGLDLTQAKVHEGDEAKRLAALASTEDKRSLADLMEAGDLLVVSRTLGPKVTREDEEGAKVETELLPKEMVMLVGKAGEGWKVVALGQR